MEYKLEPWAHQKKSIELIVGSNINFFALFFDMGAGKTKTVIEILRGKCIAEKKLLKTLIICPIAVLHNWKREILTHSHIEEKEIQIIDGTSKVKFSDKELKNPNKKRLEEQLTSDKSIFIINPEKVGNASSWDFIYQFSPDFIIVDESHRFKDPKGKRVKALHKFLDKTNPKYRFILTGSPILNSQLDIWSQYFILNPDILGRNYYSFLKQYFYDANAGMPSNVHFPNWKIKDKKYYKSIGKDLSEKDTLSTLTDIIYRHAHRVMKSEVLDLPPFTYQTLEVELTKEQGKIYRDMEAEAVAFLDSKEVDLSNLNSILSTDLDDLEEAMVADTALVRILRMQQIVAGIFSSDNGEIELIKNNRYKILKEALESILSNPENKAIVWTVFSPTYELIGELCEELKVEHTFLTGKQGTKEKQDNVDKFNTDKNCRVMIANQGAGGTGINLTAANYSIYFTRSFKLEHDLQSEARNYRGGQNKSVTRIDLITPNSIDADILEALKNKKKMADDILEVSKEFTGKDILNLLKK